MNKKIEKFLNDRNWAETPHNIYVACRNLHIDFDSLGYGSAKDILIPDLTEIIDGDGYADHVHLISHEDTDIEIKAPLNDILMFQLRDMPTTGYCWNFSDIKDNPQWFDVLHEESINMTLTPGIVGGMGVKTFIARIGDAPGRTIQVANAQPWDGGAVGTVLTLTIEV